jgi:hypothetical protein
MQTEAGAHWRQDRHTGESTHVGNIRFWQRNEHAPPGARDAGAVAGATAAAPGAKAAILSIPAVGFSQFCDPGCSTNPPTLDRGVLKPAAATTLYAAVDFPTNGEKICSLSLVYQDKNNNDPITARLYRKSFAAGVSNAFNNPVVIATVNSAAGVSDTARKAATMLDSPTINEISGFYFVQVSLPTINLNLIGVQIDYRPSCPAP